MSGTGTEREPTARYQTSNGRGFYYRFGGPEYDDDNGAGPTYPPYGLNLEETLRAQEQFTRFARGRLVANEATRNSHDPTIQSFENKSIPQVIRDVREELADIVNYLTFLDIHLQRIASELGARGVA